MDWRTKFMIFVTVFPIVNTRQGAFKFTDEVPTMQPETTVTETDESTLLARHITNFGLNLQNEMLKQNPNKNIIISPTSIAGILAMMLLGSVGETFNEIVQAIGFSSDVVANQKYHHFFGEQLRLLNYNESSSKTLFGNAVFVSQKSHLRQLYRDYLDRVYRSLVLNVDFLDQNRSIEIINNWVREQTYGKISRLLKDPIPGETKIILASAIYFSGQWLMPFVPEYTKKMIFHKPGRDIETNLMFNQGHFKYINSIQYDCQLVIIPYNDSVTNLYALKPLKHSNTTLPELLNRLNADIIENLIQSAEKKPTVIRFPKMNLKSGKNLKDPLLTLGIQKVFSPEANFAIMIDNNYNEHDDDNLIYQRIGDPDIKQKLNSLPNPGLHVDSVIHEVAITIDEYGTEASAATVGILARSANIFIADSPFYFFIRNEVTKLVTFSAAIFDPTT